MPVYDYRCKDCSHDFVVIESLDEHEDHEDHEDHKGTQQKCPKCEGANVERVITSVHVQT